MDVEQIRHLITTGVMSARGDVRVCRAELDAVRAVRGMLDAHEIAVLRLLDDATAGGRGPSPDEELAAAAKKSTGSADKVRRRQKVADDVPELGLALEDGDTTGERLDHVARATAGMTTAERERFAQHGARLRDAARDLSEREFRLLVDRLAGQARADDGADRLEKQRRAQRLRSWRDHDGMFCVSGRFDPESGLAIEATLRRTVESMFHTGIPDNAPLDPIDRQQFLNAVALARLMTGSNASSGANTANNSTGSTGGFAPGTGPDITVIIDERTFTEGRHEGSRFEVGFDLTDNGLPVQTIRRWACLNGVTPAIVGATGTRLLLGRRQRLASRDQRRALRVLYPTCALCDTAFENCEIHHLHPWEHGGATDIDNLLPLCVKHHHLAHEGGWHLQLQADRTLRVTRPGGIVTDHGPPTARAA
ncbi:MAG: HNH endonuclease signature motif containing protein [Ilumatobacteraceae bacterium]